MHSPIQRQFLSATTSVFVVLAASGPALAAATRAGSGVARPSTDRSTTTIGYSSPIAPVQVVNPFQAPPTPYAAGHRGVDLATRPGAVVSAAAAGRVSFAGVVAGRGVVVIAHANGVSTEYEPIHPLVRAGQLVARGYPSGSVAGSHDGCPPDRCLHWGARRDGVYFDPMSLLEQLGPVRLLPWTQGPT